VKEDRLKLSKAFFRVNAYLVRINFLFAGILALVAPEFIRIVLGAQWMPMLDAFRLMIIYTLLDPIKLTVANVITASGAPEKVTRARLIQFISMIIGLFILVPRYQIAGVAIAVDLMLVIGILILFWEVRHYVDFSLTKLFGIPGLGLVVGMILARLAINLPGVLGSDWSTAGVKILVFSTLYIGTLITFERKNIQMVLNILENFIQSLPSGLTTFIHNLTKRS
jgi:O-antigen/teichoic acid export membrane protein